MTGGEAEGIPDRRNKMGTDTGGRHLLWGMEGSVASLRHTEAASVCERVREGEVEEAGWGPGNIVLES